MHNHRNLALITTLLLLIAATGAGHAAPSDLATNERMRGIVKQVVENTGGDIIGLGSWISSKKYADPLKGGKSDHDMRLLMPRGTKPEVACEEWNKVRKELTAKIRKEFGKDADTVLKTVNLYPPTQLMEGVEDTDDAVKAFKKWKQVPALSYTDEVTDNIPRKFTEGLYGEGADAFTQYYEKDAGRLFYKQNGKVYVGMTDFTHLSEGQARFTVQGTVNTSKQWISHLDDVLDGDDAISVAKYLERLERDLSKARDLARCGVDREWSQAMKAMAAELRAKPQPETLRKLTGTVRGLVNMAGRQTALLGALEGQSVTAKMILKEMLTKPGSGTSSVLDDIAKVVDAPIEKIIGGLLAVIMTIQISTVAGEEGYGEAIKQAVPMFANVPLALAMSLTDAILKDAESAGIDIVAGRQDAWDLMAGIYNGRNIEVDERTGTWDVDRLVAQVHDVNKIKSMVLARAYAAASSERKGAEEIDAKVTQRIFDRCYPVILQAWRAKREQLYGEFEKISYDLQSNSVALTASPSKSVWPKGAKSVRVALSAVSKNGIPDKAMQRMQQIAVLITGLKARTTMSYKFQPDGPVGDYPNQTSLIFTAPGRYTASVTREIKVQAQGLDPKQQLSIPVNTSAMVEIEITKPPEEKPVVKPVVKPVKPVTANRPKTVVPKPVASSTKTPAASKPPVQAKPKRTWVLVDVMVRPPYRYNKPPQIPHGEPVISEGRIEFMAQDTREATPWRKPWLEGKEFKCWATWTIPPAQASPGQKFNMALSGEYADFESPAKFRFVWPGIPINPGTESQYAPSGSTRVVPVTFAYAGAYKSADGLNLWDDDTPGRKWQLDLYFELLDVLFFYRYTYELR